MDARARLALALAPAAPVAPTAAPWPTVAAVHRWLDELRTAAWLLRHVGPVATRADVRRYLELDDRLARRAAGGPPGALPPPQQALLVEVMRRWMQLHRAGLTQLALDFPARPERARLVLGGVDWSRVLGVSHDGLLRIGRTADEARYWAERALRDATAQASWAARRAFVGTAAHRVLGDLHHHDQLRIVDPAFGAVPGWDLLRAVQRAPNPGTLEALARRGWRIERATPRAVALVVRFAAGLAHRPASERARRDRGEAVESAPTLCDARAAAGFR